MANPIRLGIVGIGRAGFGMHTEELKGKEDMFKITAACDLIDERLQKMHNLYGCKTYTRIEELIADPDVEIVDIATRSCDHFAHAKMALEAGKSVLLEKPMCETYEQAKALVELTSRPGAPRLYVRHNRRFEFFFTELRRLINEGLFGNVYDIYITRNGYSRRDDWQTIKEFGGGQLLNWGPHIVDQSLRFLESPLKSLWGDLKHTVAAGDCEDHLTIIMTGENGRQVTMQISGGMALPTPEYRVYGSRGAAEVVGQKLNLRYIDPQQQLARPIADPGTPGQSFGATGTFQSGEQLRWIERTVDFPGEDLSVIWTHMYESFRNGKPFPITLDEAISVIGVIDRIKKENPIIEF